MVSFESAPRMTLSDAIVPSAATVCDKAVALHHVGGVHGANFHPTEFLCLLLKLLQLQPDESIVMEYINAGNEDFKCVSFPAAFQVSRLTPLDARSQRYLKALGLFYARLVFSSVRVYETLEAHLKDYRKLRLRDTGEPAPAQPSGPPN